MIHRVNQVIKKNKSGFINEISEKNLYNNNLL